MAQTDRPLTLWAGLFFYTFSVWKIGSLASLKTLKEAPFSSRLEKILLLLILTLAFFLRFYQIDSLPAGMHTDQGLIGECALRIEHEGWRPFYEIYSFQVPEVLLLYQLALWFHLIGDSIFAFHLFFILLSIASLIFAYGVFRRLSGPRTALFSLFVLAVMRWNWIETRTGYPSSQVAFYLFGALYFWIFWIQKQKKWAFYLSVFFAGAGLYTYQAFKLVPFLFLIYAGYEIFRRKKESSPSKTHLFFYFLLLFIFALPLLNFMFQQKTLGHREQEVFVGQLIQDQKSLKPLWDMTIGNLLMFNRTGDENWRHNISGHRMLDDVTGIFFLLGLGLAWRRWKEPGAFYLLTAFFTMGLMGPLSNNPNNSNRLVILTFFVAYFAGCALDFFFQILKKFYPRREKLIFLCAFFLLVVMAVQNFHTYFVEQAENENCRLSLGLEQATLGQSISDLEKEHPGSFHYFIDPFYYQNHTVNFLGYAGRADSLNLDPAVIAEGKFPRDKNAVFFLAQGKAGLLDFLKVIFPGGFEGRLKDQEGSTLLYRYDVPQKVLSRFHGWNRGLKGIYMNALTEETNPVAVRIDPVLNFISKRDFPFQNYPPFSIIWNGLLTFPVSGAYTLQVLTTDEAWIEIDGRKIFSTAGGDPVATRFTKGPHSIKIQYQKTFGNTQMASLIWKKPLEDRWEVVPAEAFGKVK